jgi:hypothetical protein
MGIFNRKRGRSSSWSLVRAEENSHIQSALLVSTLMLKLSVNKPANGVKPTNRNVSCVTSAMWVEQEQFVKKG